MGQTLQEAYLAALAAAEVAISGVAAIAPDDIVTVAPGRQIAINCTVAGDVKLGFADGSTLIIPVSVGLTVLSWAIMQVFVTGTSATASYANLQ